MNQTPLIHHVFISIFDWPPKPLTKMYRWFLLSFSRYIKSCDEQNTVQKWYSIIISSSSIYYHYRFYCYYIVVCKERFCGYSIHTGETYVILTRIPHSRYRRHRIHYISGRTLSSVKNVHPCILSSMGVFVLSMSQVVRSDMCILYITRQHYSF